MNAINSNAKRATTNLKEAVELYLESFEDVEIPSGIGEIMLYPMEIAVNA